MTRLCVITPAHWSASTGGAEYQVQCLLDELCATRRFEIHYLAREFAPDLRPEGFEIHKVGRSKAVRHLGYLVDAFPLYHALADIRPDVIYQRVACGYTGIAAYYAKRHGARLVWHVSHDSDLMPDSKLEGRGLLRRTLERRAVEYGIRHAHHIVVQTEKQRLLLENNYRRAAAATIANFHPQPRETIDKSGAPLILWVANLKPWKQPEVFVRVAAALADLPNARFVMVGGMPGARLRQWYEPLIRAMGATPRLEYLGARSQDDINQMLAKAHLLINTSVHEGFPNTFIQAWMREVPVVSLHVDPDGVIESEGLGRHATSENDLIAAVRMFIEDDALRTEYAARARKYALEKHSMRNAHELGRLLELDA